MGEIMIQVDHNHENCLPALLATCQRSPIAVPPQAYQNLHYQWTDLRERLQEAMVFISKCMGLQSLFPPIESVEK